MIRVIFRDNNCEIIKASNLERMIAMGKVVAFYREGGWVDVKRDPIRGTGGTHNGPERRRR